jgi:hypothetical protein
VEELFEAMRELRKRLETENSELRRQFEIENLKAARIM